MRLRDVTRLGQLVRMERDNIDLGDYWILHCVDHVTITQQRAGEHPTAQIMIPRQTFNSLVDFYMREQKVKPARASQ